MITDLVAAHPLDPTAVAGMVALAQSDDLRTARTAALAIVGEAMTKLGSLAERPHIADSFYALAGVAIELARLDQDAALGRYADRERQRRHVAASIAGIAEAVLRAGAKA